MALTLQQFQDSVTQKVSEQIGQRLSSHQPSSMSITPQPSPIIDRLNEAFSSARSTLRPRVPRTADDVVPTQRLLVAPSLDSGITHMGTGSLIEQRALTPYQSSLASSAQLEPTEASGTTPAMALYTPPALASQLGNEPTGTWTFSDWDRAGHEFAAQDFTNMALWNFENRINQPLGSGPPMNGGQSSANVNIFGIDPGPAPMNAAGQSPENSWIDGKGEQLL